MSKIIVESSKYGPWININYVCDEGSYALTTSDLSDFVDSDIDFFYDGVKSSVNDYLGESVCFSARISQSGYNPF